LGEVTKIDDKLVSNKQKTLIAYLDILLKLKAEQNFEETIFNCENLIDQVLQREDYFIENSLTLIIVFCYFELNYLAKAEEKQ
jgi:hypothetical protein